MEPTFQSYVECAGAELKCPSCDSNALHHEKVEVFDREDDETEGLHVVISGGKVTTDRNLDGNPSRRRNGLSISFWCENCYLLFCSLNFIFPGDLCAFLSASLLGECVRISNLISR